ncbi:MAG: hypothetical protein RMJ16_10055 [Thermoguttaceae bacterium]|nr:hypothetical protein [Thermoguttaceae bacterium]
MNRRKQLGLLRSVIAVVFLAVVMGVVAGGSGSAQETPSRSSLLMLVRCNPDLTQSQVEETLRFGIQQAGCSASEIVVREVPPHTLDEIEAIVRKVEPQEVAVQLGQDVSLFRRPSVAAVWEFRLRTASAEIVEKLEVGYAAKLESQPETLNWVTYTPERPDVVEKNRAGLAAVSVGNGRYEFYPAAELGSPVAFRMHLRNEEGGTRELRGNFPLMDRCYFIQLVDFQGDRTALFSAMRDPRKVPNPFSDIRERTTVTLVFGNLQATGGIVGESLDGLELVVNVPGVPGRVPARVWMLFPLNEQTLKEEEAKLQALEPIGPKLSEEIRKRAVRTTDQRSPIVEDLEPRWYELQSAGTGFEGRIQLVSRKEDFAKLQEKFPRVFRILVWEFEAGNIVAPIRLVGGKVYRAEELFAWPRLLDAATRTSASKPEGPTGKSPPTGVSMP